MTGSNVRGALGITGLSLAVLLLPAGTTWAATSPPQHWPICHGGHRVTCVVDGDTVWLDGSKIRLEDIDAPEVSQPRCPAEKALGDQATARLQQLLEGAAVTVTQVGNRALDPYGRELRTLSVSSKSVGQILVAEGLAHEWVGHKLPWC